MHCFIATLGLIVLYGHLPIHLVAQTNTTNVTITEKYLPEVIKDDLIQILHVHNVIIKKEDPQEENDYIEMCKRALANLSNIGTSLISNDSGFERPVKNSIVDDILNITSHVNSIQKEMNQEKEKTGQYARLLNDSLLERDLSMVISRCESFSQDVTQVGWQENPQIVALFVSYCIVLEARILGLMHTFAIVIKIHNKVLWRPQFDFDMMESNLTKHWEFLALNVDKKLKTINNTEVNELDEPFSLKGIGEGVLLNAVQLNNNKQCACPTTGVHNVSQNNTPAVLEQFSKYSTCLGDVYGCKSGEMEYKICFPPQQLIKKRYRTIQVGSESGNKFYGGKKMPKASSCFPSEHIEAKYNCLFCQCKCFEPQGTPKILNTFSLGEVVSDVSQNRIVLGIQFQLIDSTVTLQIQENTIHKFGLVHTETIPNYTKDKLTGDKFHMSAIHHSIALSDIYALPNEVITGVRFIAHPIQLQIRVHKYNFFTGELEKSNGTWRSSEEKSLNKFPVENLEPRKDNDEDTYKIFDNIEIEFEPTAWDTDLASNIIPYFDTGSHENEKVPLMGLGLIYRNRTEREAGVISPRIHKYKFSKLWVPQHVTVKEEKKSKEVTQAGSEITMIVPIVGVSLVGIGALWIAIARKRKRQSMSENSIDAPKILDTVSFRANDKSSSENSSSNEEESSNDESDSSSSDNSDSSIEPLSLNRISSVKS